MQLGSLLLIKIMRSSTSAQFRSTGMTGKQRLLIRKSRFSRHQRQPEQQNPDLAAERSFLFILTSLSFLRFPRAQLPSQKFHGVFFSPPLIAATAAGDGGSRRILHEPLYPIQWTPPPPPSDYPDPITEAPKPPFPLSAGRHSNSGATKLAIGVSVSVFAAAILSLFAYFRYRRRAKNQPDSRKLIEDSGRSAAPDRPIAAADFLYLGTMEPSVPAAPRLSAESNRSSYRKLSSEFERVVEMRIPSPELQPLPPLRRHYPPAVPPAVAAAAATLAVAASSDDETYFTPKRSATSRNSESTGSPRSRRNQSSSIAEKEVPRSRRSSPKMQLSDHTASDVKLENSPNSHSPPPHPPTNHPPVPPPPPPPPPKMEKNTKLPQPWNQPQSFSRVIKELNEISHSPLPSSRRQLLRPLPPEDAARADVQRSINARPVSGSSTSKPVDEEEGDLDSEAKPKLKPLHWDKVRATSDRAMVWDQLKSDSFHLNEDRIEALFVNNSTAPPPREQSRRTVLPPLKQEERVLDAKKSQNIAILLRALNVTREEVSEALLEGNTEGLGAELFETLVKMAPTKEEELKLRDYIGDVSKLGPAERFLKGVLDIPFAFKRVDAMLYKSNFETEVNYLRTSFGTLEAACEDLRSSRLFFKLLEAVLRTGNRMNVGTNHGEAKAFKLDALLKLADVKGTDGKTTVLHFVVQEIIRSEGSASEASIENQPSKNMEEDFKKKGLQVIAGLSNELGNVKKAAGMDTDVLNSYLSKLELGLQKIRSVLQLGASCEQGQMFFESMRTFLQNGEHEIGLVKSEEKRALLRVKEVTEYFHGDAAKEEAHPLRIFMVVRDFLAVLDHVCKDVKRLHENTVMGSAKAFRLPASSSLPVLHRYVPNPPANSDDDS
ncbi:formin-like protein 8 [Phalaenopsis equestris]|uniref:formin-like protein 8 n=1 Tax=Phalaenopsis equestris TaxID=78828 RepID=UPI0009E2DFA8|nr:formin-like protein 8 [Phalaenopsis equestris]